MSLMLWVARHLRKQGRIEELADQLAAACVAEIHRRVSDQVYGMSLHEGRGYIRARSVSVVQRVTAAAERREHVATRELPRLRNLVLDSATRTVQDQLHALPRTRLRRAA